MLRTDETRTIRLQSKRRLIPNELRRIVLKEYDNNTDEFHALNAIEKHLGSQSCYHFPKCYGFVETDLGPGLCLDLIRDSDGGISKSVRELLSDDLPLNQLVTSFNALSEFLLRHCIVTRAILDHNIVARRSEDAELNLYIIDGLGDGSFFKISKFLPSLARRRIKKKTSQAWRRFEELERNGGVSTHLRRNSSWDQGFLRHDGTGSP